MDIIYYDNNIIVAIKPAGVISTDEPGGMPSLLRQALGNENADIRTVHRLDQVVSGLMVFAQNPETASELSRQIRAGEFKKTYLAVVRGVPQERKGRMEDILLRSKEQRKTFVVNKPCRGSQEAVLDYRLLGSNGELSMVEINLVTGRTHQIRAHLAYLGHPVLGDIKYGNRKMNERTGTKTQALCAVRISFLDVPEENTLHYLSGKVIKLKDPQILQQFDALDKSKNV